MKKCIGFVPFLLFIILNSSSALAADASLPFSVSSGPGMTEWFLRNTGGTSTGLPFSGTCDGTAGFTINDADDADDDSDAYDHAYSIWVDNSIFIAPDPVDLTGNTVTAGPVAMSGLNVTMEYAFSDEIQAGRIRAIFQNPTGAPISIAVSTAMNPGSDSSTTIEATSSGDTAFNTADRWVVTSDGGPSDPVNTTVLWGPDAAEMPTFATTTVFECSSDDGIGATFNITIPANSTRALMFFAGLGDIVGLANTIAGAITNAAMFDDNGSIHPSLLVGMSEAELAQILNWAFEELSRIIFDTDGNGNSCSLHSGTSSAWVAGDMWLLLALIAGLGLWRLHRRKQIHL